MRILLLTQIVPYPPDSGPKVKTYHVLRYLAERGYQVTLASFVRKNEERDVQYLVEYCSEIHAVPLRRSRIYDVRAYAHSLRSGLPFLVTRDAHVEMQRLIRQLAQQRFDIVHADQLTMAQFALQFRHASRLTRNESPAIAFDAHNAVYAIVERARQTAPVFFKPVLALEARRLRKYERGLIRQFDHTLAVSEIDKQVLLKAADENPGSHNPRDEIGERNLKSRISVIPIAVDCTRLQPVKHNGQFGNVITVSTLFYPPNADGVRWFMRDVFPLVRTRVPGATLTVIGPRPPKDIIDFGTERADYIQVTGYVADLQPYFERAAVMVVPVRAGSGMRVRILEAMARGIPVVTTTTGVEGINAIHGEHLLVADEPAEFATTVARLLSDPQLRESLIHNARKLVEEKYDWQVVLPSLEAVYQSLGVK